jgi:hypothetical protein
VKLLDPNAGFDTSSLLSLEVYPAGPRYNAMAATMHCRDRVREVVCVIPGEWGFVGF